MRKLVFAGPWYGEFGWETMIWQSYLRKLSREYDKMIISTFPGMEPLYVDFHCEVVFLPHQHPDRALEWRDTSLIETGFDATEYTVPVEYIKPIKQFKVEGEFVVYGTPIETDLEVLFHARDIQKASFKNYAHEKWDELGASFPKAASVGSLDDYHVSGTIDKRGIPLQELMDLMASSQVIVGQSSGVMHLATLCGLKQVVWGDNKTYFSETLERRYKEIWNPLGTPVAWIETEAWDPDPNEILKGMLQDQNGRPSQKALNVLKSATEAEKYIIAIVYYDEKDGKAQIESYCEKVSFPDDKLVEAVTQIKRDLDTICEKSGIADNGEGGDIWA